MMDGMPVHVSRALPLPPPVQGSPEWVTRYVRDGLADVLEWLGEDPGPAPDEATHAYMVNDGGRVSVFMSAERFASLKAQVAGEVLP